MAIEYNLLNEYGLGLHYNCYIVQVNQNLFIRMIHLHMQSSQITYSKIPTLTYRVCMYFSLVSIYSTQPIIRIYIIIILYRTR